MPSMIYRRSCCRACEGRNLELIFSLKPTPIGDAYVDISRLKIEQPSYPIDLYMCADCGLAQLLDVISPSILYGDYIYVTTSSMGLLSHFQEYASAVVKRCGLTVGSFVVDIGSNDGTLLSCFQNEGMTVLGVEPADHIAKQATLNGIPTTSNFFTLEVVSDIVKQHGKAQLVTANNVVANIDDLLPLIRAVKELMADEGVFVFESYYLADVIENFVFDFIYHEHVSALSVKPMQLLFSRMGLQLVAIERIATKGGSLRYFVQKSKGPLKDDGSVSALRKYEDSIGLYTKAIYVEFAKKIDELKKQLLSFLRQAKSEGKSIAGFGASITGTTLIYHFELGEYLDYLIDDNEAKQGRYSPGLHLEVVPGMLMCKRKPDYVIILAWRFAALIAHKYQDYIEDGGHFIIPVPEFSICKKKSP